MDHLYAPWRSRYFSQKTDECVFCQAAKNPKDDEKNRVLFRAKHCFGIMNLYPYSPGAFMVVPYDHIDNIESLSDEAWLEMSLEVRKGVEILKKSINASGVNIGMNLGKASGAGIAWHVHYHLVPRWVGDTNFITTIGETRINGSSFDEIYKKIKENYKEN
ncbi:MAG: HIT domain-containing protein [Campylobacter sp.]|nr:HIT domain-containing protein [Campylobacter sp.]